MSGDAIGDEEGEALIRDDDATRIVLVGRTGAGKSATGNTILGPGTFKSEFSFVSVTSKCVEASGVVNGRNVSLVDTPGLCDTRFSEDENVKHISGCIELAAPGPHALLHVVKLERFTDDHHRSVEVIQKVFGQKSNEYTMVLFTNGDQLKGRPFEDMLMNCPNLRELVTRCKGGCHVFNNETPDPSQVTELLVKINRLVSDNGGSHYTNEMFQEAARKIEEEKERERREKRAQDQKLREDMREEMRDEASALDVLGITTGLGMTAGGALGSICGVLVTEAAELALAAAVGGPIGVGLGFGAGLIAGGCVNYNHQSQKKRKRKEKKYETSEESELLMDAEQSIDETE